MRYKRYHEYMYNIILTRVSYKGGRYPSAPDLYLLYQWQTSSTSYHCCYTPGVKHIILGTSLWEAGCMLAAWYSKMDGDRARDTFDPSRWLPFLPNHSIQHNIDTFSSLSPDRILRGLGDTVHRYTGWWYKQVTHVIPISTCIPAFVCKWREEKHVRGISAASRIRIVIHTWS